MKTTALIMAGGRGERFWPRSRKSLPKQFLSLTGDGRTMIQLTVERILPLVNIEDIFIATNKDYKELVKQQLPKLPEENILCEPVGRNTAPCIGLGAVHIAKKYEDALMLYEASHRAAAGPKKPVDSLYARAFLYEKLSRLPEAVRMWEEIICALTGEYGITAGETIDWPKRELERLRKVL